MKKAIGAVLRFGFVVCRFLFHLGRTLYQRHPVFVKYGLGIALLGYLVWRNWDGLMQVSERPLHFGPLALALALSLGGVLLTFVRWYILVRAVGLPFTVTDALRLGMVGYFFSIFMPGSVGGDIVRAAFLARENRRRTVAVATVLIDRAVGLWALFWLMAILGTVFWIRGDLKGPNEDVLQFFVLGSGSFVAVSALCWLLLGLLPDARAERFAGRLAHGIPKVGRQAAEFWRAVWMYRKEGKSLWFALALSLVSHVGFVLLFYFSALSVQYDAQNIPSVVEHFLIIPIGMIAQAVGITPGGLGIGEFAFSKLYEMMGKGKLEGFLGSMIQRVLTWILAVFGYLGYLRMQSALNAESPKEEAEPVAA